MTKAANGATDLDGDVAFSDLPHVESDCGNHVFTELTRLKKKRNIQLYKDYIIKGAESNSDIIHWLVKFIWKV